MHHRISFIGTAAIEIEKTGGQIVRFTLPEGWSVPEEFNVGDEVEIKVYAAYSALHKTSYCEIRRIASGKIIKAFYKI